MTRKPKSDTKRFDEKEFKNVLNLVRKRGRDEKFSCIIIGAPLSQLVYKNYLSGKLTGVRVAQLRKPF